MLERLKNIGFELYNSNPGWSYYRYYATYLDNIEYHYSLTISAYSTEFRVFLCEGNMSTLLLSDNDGNLIDKKLGDLFKMELRDVRINQVLT
tara:strand:- start:4043 stop:4318 length:276 start_codon:yes stop_codon:yes gene_type:complete